MAWVGLPLAEGHRVGINLNDFRGQPLSVESNAGKSRRSAAQVAGPLAPESALAFHAILLSLKKIMKIYFAWKV